jgi:hypothetical protein
MSPSLDSHPDIVDSYARLLAHPIFHSVDDLHRLHAFMEDHVYAVWDFMSLAKRLQRDFTCVTLPWQPPADPVSARLINEIVTGEESDVGPDGQPISHLELYLGAMEEVGADIQPFRLFLGKVRSAGSVAEGFRVAGTPSHVKSFVQSTLRTAGLGQPEEVLASFFFGRENVIPAMFKRLAATMRGRLEAPMFQYYLDRHIQLDGDAHGPAALRMIEGFIGGDAIKRRRALDAAREAIEARIRFFDGVLASVLGEGDTGQAA